MNQWIFITLICILSERYSTYAFKNRISAKKYFFSIIILLEFVLLIDNAMRGILIPDNFVFCLLVWITAASCATLVHIYRLKNTRKA